MLINRYVNIGIVTFNRLEFTKKALESIIKYTSFPHVITVVDNGSQDGTQEYLQELSQSKIIDNLILLDHNIGVAKASNLAWLQEPNALYYLKYDNDIVIQKNNWLSKLITVIDNIPEIGVLGYNFEPVSYPLKVFRNHKIRVKEEGNIGGACFLIPKRTQDILGYWCEDYGLYGFEDVDYSFRVKLAGLLNVYMEDEEIGIHLPAGKAPIIDGRTWCASDGIEEVNNKKYRNFKDLQLQDNIISGIIDNNFNKYLNKTCPLYIDITPSLLSNKSNYLELKYPMNNIVNNEIYKANSEILRVDLGSGTNKPKDFIGVDICPGVGIDIVADLSKRFPFENDSVDEVRAHDVIEHLPNNIHTMNEIWRICKPGAKVDIFVPSTDGRGAFQDPTHISFWNINSFLYYSIDFPEYLELCKRYGFLGAFKIVKLEHEESPGQVIHVRAEMKVIKFTTQRNINAISEKKYFDEKTSASKEKEATQDGTLLQESLIELNIKLSNYIEQYQQNLNNRFIIAKLRHTRKKIVNTLLSLSLDDLTNNYLDELSNILHLLFSSHIKTEPLTQTENILVEEFLSKIYTEIEQDDLLKYLLVLMLYLNPWQLKENFIFELFNHSLLNDDLRYILMSPQLFTSPGEADNYYEYMQNILEKLHSYILANKNSDICYGLADTFSNYVNFLFLYFNEKNLKDLYFKRAEILEYVLQCKGYSLDFKFNDISTNRRKIRLGLLAVHFNPSAETFASLPIYEYLSRDFEVILYSLIKTGHPLEQYCQTCANSFKLLPQDLSEQVSIIRADDLDILFIATNVTAVTNQICLLAMHRLARIQVTSGGSVVTTGMKHIDYYISGTLTDPLPKAQEQYRENLVKLEGTAHCFSYGIEQIQLNFEVDRESLGISEDAVVFVSGANFFKIIPELINTWSQIIVEVPNSVLLLLPYGPNWSNAYPKKAFESYLNKVFGKYAISADRLIVLDPQPVPNREEFKEYLKIADIYLDSYPFAGTTSLIEPLQLNLPVITRQGNSFRSAMGAAIIQSLDVSNLVAYSEESYIQLAIALANNPELRQQKRKEIKDKMQDNPIFLDSRSYAAKIECLFKDIFNNYLVDTLNQNLHLREINLIIFPDWSQPEESIGLELEQVIKATATYPDSQKTTLLIDTSNIAMEDAEIFLSSVVMNLLMNEDLDITEELEISLLGKLGDHEWLALLPKLAARIILESEDKFALTQVPIQRLAAFNIDKLMTSHLEIASV